MRLWPGVLLIALAGPVAAADPKPPMFEMTITYLTRAYEPPLPLSLVEKPVEDPGLMGARLADKENRLTGRLMNQKFALAEHVLPLDAPFPETARAVLAASPFVVADLEAADLRALAALPEAAGVMILSTRAADDDLRTDACLPNVFHIAPSWQMKADGLAQYLVWKGWRDWLLIRGKAPEDIAYATALTRAAEKFGAKLVETRDYAFEAGARRVEGGHQQTQTQMPAVTRGARAHDVVVVADAAETFGDYLPYRTHDPRPVVGTHGLSSGAWHRSFEQFGSMSLHSAFEKLADRPITEADYLAWLGVKTFAETALRSGKADPATVRQRLTAPDFVVPGFKGIGLSFRPWDQQLRQPMVIAWARSLISMSPQDEFLHARHALDSLGHDAPESRCRLNPM